MVVPCFGQDSIMIEQLADDYENTDNDSVRLKIIIDLLGSSTKLDDVDTAIQIAKKGLRLAIEQEDSLSMAKSYAFIARFYAVQSNYNESLKADTEALNLFKELDFPKEQAKLLNSIGEDYFLLDLYNEAFDYYTQSMELAKTSENKLYEIISTYNIGKLFMETGEFDKAKKYIERSMGMSREEGDTLGIAYSKNDLALLLINEGKYAEALDELKEAYEISESLNEDILTPQIVVSMAKAFHERGDYKLALIHFNEAQGIYKKQNNKSGLATVLYGKGSVSVDMGNILQAKQQFTQCIDIAKELGDDELLVKSYKSLADIYEDEQNLRLALAYYREYKELEDSIYSKKKKEQFEQLQLQKESARKDAEILALNQKEAEQLDELKDQEFIRNILVVILAFTGVLLFSLYKNNIKRRKKNELLVAQQAEIESKSKELSSLLEVKDKFFSIVSHDLRSPINSLLGILEIMDKDNITEAEMRKMSHALRVRLNNTKKLLDTLLDWAMLQMHEIKIVKQEINLANLANDNFEFFRDIGEKEIVFVNDIPEGKMVSADRNMLDLIIRNIISNSIKFTEVGGEVRIYSKEESGDKITVSIEDNGVGMPQHQIDTLFDTSEFYTTRGTANEKGTGLGLRLCKEFVERMGGKIWVESTIGKGSIFNFTVSKV